MGRWTTIAGIAHRLLLWVGMVACVLMVIGTYFDLPWVRGPARVVTALALLPAVLIFLVTIELPPFIGRIKERWRSWRKS
jgi:hypothetical protein